MGFWAVAGPMIASAIGSHITATAQNKAVKKRLASEAEGRARRTAKANQLAEQFNKVSEQIDPEAQKVLFSQADAKNLKAFNDTEQNSEVKIGQGLNLGGEELAEFTQLKRLADQDTAKRNNARKYFHSQFLSPNNVNSKVGNYATQLSLGRNRLADELVGDKIGDDLETSAIRPNQAMLALGDAIRIGGQMYGMYNMASSLGSTTAPDLSGLDGISTTGYTAPASAGSTTSLGQAFGGGATQGFAPGDAMNMWAKPPTPAWPASGGGWFGG